MRRDSAAILVVLALLFFGSAAHGQDTAAQLKARAEQAKPREQLRLFMSVAELQAEAADKLYAAGEYDKAKADIDRRCGTSRRR